jgi:chromosome segregation ATPase
MDLYGNTAPSEAEMRPEVQNEAIVQFPVASTRAIPITQEPSMTNLNTQDAYSVSAFFQSLADKVVLASTLPKEVEELRAVVEQLKRDVDSYREHNARMDEEINNLRRERQQLQDENAALRTALAQTENDRMVAETRWNQACTERDRWHNDFITASTAGEDYKRERDDAQMKMMEMEDKVHAMETDRDYYKQDAERYCDKLNSIRSALA